MGRSALLLLLGVLALPAWAQTPLQLVGESTGANVIVEGRSDDPDAPDPLFQAVWRGVPGAAAQFQIQRTAQPDGNSRLMLDRLMEAGIGAYLDARVRFTKHGVVSDVPSGQLVSEIDAMVKAAAKDLGASGVFGGLSEPTRMQLSRLTHIDWSQARHGVDAGEEQDKYLAIYYYVRSQREELERQLRADLLPLASVAVLGKGVAEPGSQVRINSTCGTVFDEQNYLCALDLQLADTGGGGIDPRLAGRLMAAMDQSDGGNSAPALDTPEVQQKIRKRDRWLKAELDAINDRIDRMDQRKELWAIRDRMEDIEDRLTGLELEVREGNARTIAENPSADLSDLVGQNITLRFARASVRLDTGHRVLLNEVFEQLARVPQHRVLITGYSDRSGDAVSNLLISEQRARAVRNYLMQRGISADRLMVNFYGDSRSIGRDPGERRVEVEWIR
ncbi:MAG: OmpA family protein [Flavobacteriales bacterium]|nr:OmpA family protein [Flavobacteriales bacterium]